MGLKSKLSDFGKNTTELYKKGRSLTLPDVWKTYRTILKRLPDVSHLKNIVLFGGLGSLLIFILFAQRFGALYVYLPKTPVVGGEYSEGVIGKIEQLNPLYAPTNSAESAAASIIFSGLTKKDGNRQNIPDLAEKWEVSPDGKTYTFFLKRNVVWHDGQKFTADDVLFTVNTVQNPDARSPYLEVWKGVEVQKEDDSTLVFKLQNPFASFLSVTDLPIIPKHILEMVPARNLKIAEFNSKPIGTGPYQFESLKKIKDTQIITLATSSNYYGKSPYISKVSFRTYPDPKSMIEGYAKKEITGLERLPISETDKKQLPNINNYELAIPKYDALYFNLRTGVTKDKAVRDAIATAVDRTSIIKNSYQGEAIPLYTPILPGYIGFDSKIKQTFDKSSAKAKVAALGFTADANGVLKKGDAALSVRLLSSDQPEQIEESEIIESSLKEIGFEVKQETYPLNALITDHVRPRDFDLMLLPTNLGVDSDLYALWDSGNATDPGLNISGFSDKRVDKFLEQARTSSDPNFRRDRLQAAQKIITDELGAVFICWPDYIYPVSKEVKGLSSERLTEPQNRFWNIENWYLLDKLL